MLMCIADRVVFSSMKTLAALKKHYKGIFDGADIATYEHLGSGGTKWALLDDKVLYSRVNNATVDLMYAADSSMPRAGS